MRRTATSILAFAFVVAAALPAAAAGDAREADRLRERARIAAERKDYPEAESLLDRAFKADRSKTAILKDLAVVFASDGKIVESVARYRQYLELVPGDDAARLAMATTLSWSKDPALLAEADKLLTAYMASHPDADDALLQRARVRSWSGQPVPAEKDFRAYLAKHPGESKVKLELAMALSGNKEPAALNAAIAIYDAHLASNPGDLDIVLQRARVHSWANHPAEAATDFRAYLQAKPDDQAARLELARVLRWSGQAAQAVAALRALVAAKPDDEAAKLELARALVRSDRPDDVNEGLLLLDRHVATHPGDEEAFLERARARAAAKKTTLAIADLRAYLGRHPHDEKVALELAEVLASSTDKAVRRDALTLYGAHLAAHPDDARVLLARGRLRAELGMSDEAVQDLAAYRQLKHDDDAADLEIANVLAQGAAPKQSIPYYDAYVARHPQDAAARTRRARALLWGGDYPRAESELEELRRSAKTDAEKNELDLELVRLYAQTSRRFDAADLVEKVLERDPKSAAALTERARLQVVLGSRLEPRVFYYEDKSRIRISSLTVEARAALSRNFAFIADVGGYTLGTAAETLLTSRGNLGAWVRYRALELEATVGPRVYQYFGPSFGTRAAARVRPARWASLSLDYQYDDIYFDMLQPASVSSGIRGHALHLTGEGTLPLGVRLTGRVGSRLLQPDNRSFDSTATLQVPIVGPLSAGYNVQYIAWRFNDPTYWSPQAFAAHLGLVRVAQTFAQSGFGYDLQGVAGIAGERIQGAPEAGFGLSFGVSGTVSYQVSQRVLLRLGAQYSQTVRRLPRPVLGGSTPSDAPGADAAEEEPSIYWWVTGTASAIFYL
jgi:predicted Zn-dependent protease